jgi:hypothetical protein
MDDISELIPFSRLRQLRARDVSRHINQCSSSDTLPIHEGLISIFKHITIRHYFVLNQRCVAKLNYNDTKYDFTVLDLWSEKEM